MIMTPKVKTSIIAVCVLLVLSASIFTYSWMSGKNEVAPSTTKIDTTTVTKTETAPVAGTKVETLNTSTETEAKKEEETAGGKPSGAAVNEQNGSAEGRPQNENIPNPQDSSSDEEEQVLESNNEHLNANEGETIVYVDGSIILLLDLNTKLTTEIIPPTDFIGANFFKPKLSPDGKRIAFKHSPVPRDLNQETGIYVANLDGSNMRRIIEGDDCQTFDFGPSGDSIIYSNRYGHLEQFKIDSSPRIYSNIAKSINPHEISCFKGHLYWISRNNSDDGLEIWRRSMKSSFSEPERIYSENSVFVTASLKISPDEKHLILERNLDWVSPKEIFIIDIQNKSAVGPLRFNQNNEARLKNCFWSLDGEWIYAERFDREEPGLVRFRFDSISTSENPIELKLVVPGFRTYYGAAFVPRNFEYEDYEQEFRIIPYNQVFVHDHYLSAPFTAAIPDFNETIVFSTITHNIMLKPFIVSFNTESKIFKEIIGKVTRLDEEDRSDMWYIIRKVSSDGKLIVFTKSQYGDYNRIIYLINADGSQVRKIDPCSRIRSLDFGPNDESILFSDSSNTIKQIDLSGDLNSDKEVVNDDHNEAGFEGISMVSYACGHVYWQAMLEGKFEIWRKNLLIEGAQPELVYNSGSSSYPRLLADYKVSPDGKRLFVAEFYEHSSKVTVDIFGIDETSSPMIREQANTYLNESFDNFYWNIDSHGQNWIYAEKSDRNNSTGLVRSKANEGDDLEFEMVIPEFKSFSGITILPKTD